jgi:ribosomal protection tetracycline resistance protein
MKRINIGIMAHVDAGKTSITEQFLYHTGAIRTIGRVDKGTAHTDFLGVERSRGISVRAAVTMLETRDAQINLIDTPGHVDFSGEVERTLMVIDGVILIVSAVEGVQAHTEIIWEALKKRGIPVIFFINKIDRTCADVYTVISQIKERLTSELCVLYNPSDQGQENASIVKQDITECIAERDEKILETYLEGNVTSEAVLHAAREIVISAKLFPVLCGSAMYGTGIDELLDCVTEFFPYAHGDREAPVSGIVFKVDYDPVMGKTAHVRLYQGRLCNRDSVTLVGRSGHEGKITQIRKFYGEKYKDTGLVEAGDIAALCGLSGLAVGDIIGCNDAIPKAIKWVMPLLNVSVFPAAQNSFQDLVRALSILNEEDPLLEFYSSKETGELLLSITGMIQTEVLTEILRERFNLEVSFGKPSVIYKETPLKEGEGFDAYTMPKPCWAVLKFKIEPGLSGNGIMYKSEVPPKKIPYRYQNHVEIAVPKALRQGLKGWEVIDANITLIDGGYHDIHTHPLDFFVATPIALMKGLQNTGTALLEPILSFRIVVPQEFGGKIIGEIIKMRGSFESPFIENGRFIITGLFPVATSMEFPIMLASITSGKGIVSTRFHSYQKCPEDVDATLPYRGINPLDRSKFILWARNAFGQFGSEV